MNNFTDTIVVISLKRKWWIFNRHSFWPKKMVYSCINPCYNDAI